MRRFDCEKRLEAARIPIYERPLPEGIKGMAFRHPSAGYAVLLAEQLAPVERRCTLTHEFYHLALYPDHVFSFHDTMAGKLRESRIEHRVRMATADHLISRSRLLRACRAAQLEQLDLSELAERLDVTLEVLEDALTVFELRR